MQSLSRSAGSVAVAILPQHLFGWRREARYPAIEADPLSFVPALCCWHRRSPRAGGERDEDGGSLQRTGSSSTSVACRSGSGLTRARRHHGRDLGLDDRGNRRLASRCGKPDKANATT